MAHYCDLSKFTYEELKMFTYDQLQRLTLEELIIISSDKLREAKSMPETIKVHIGAILDNIISNLATDLIISVDYQKALVTLIKFIQCFINQ